MEDERWQQLAAHRDQEKTQTPFSNLHDSFTHLDH